MVSDCWIVTSAGRVFYLMSEPRRLKSTYTTGIVRPSALHISQKLLQESRDIFMKTIEIN